jgi:arginine decarboxylase
VSEAAAGRSDGTAARAPVTVPPPREVSDDQSAVPYVEALRAHAARSPARYNVPGHQAILDDNRALADAFGEQALVMDIPPIIDGIDAGARPTPFERSQQLAAHAWGARRTWFLANGASSANHAICIALRHICKSVVVQRNVHTSTVDGLIASGLVPTFAVPEVDERLGIAHCLTPAELERALREAPDARAAIVVSPTYYGFSADLAGLREVTARHGVALVVDEAWGAHFAFSRRLPPSALSQGADLVVSSTHKMLGSLTQSAMLHAGSSVVLDDVTIDRAVSLLESTSPSALLAGSLDIARRRAAIEGEALLTRAITAAAAIRLSIDSIPGLSTLAGDQIGSFGIAGFDPLRITIDASGSRRGGGEINRRLNHAHGVFLELVSERVLVAILGMGARDVDGGRLIGGLRETLSKLEPDDGLSEGEFGLPPSGELQMSPRDAFFAPTVAVPAAQAQGHVAAETLAVYPPGIPNVLPGERISSANLDHILAAHARGLTVRGPANRTLETIRVVAGSSPC